MPHNKSYKSASKSDFGPAVRVGVWSSKFSNPGVGVGIGVPQKQRLRSPHPCCPVSVRTDSRERGSEGRQDTVSRRAAWERSPYDTQSAWWRFHRVT